MNGWLGSAGSAAVSSGACRRRAGRGTEEVNAGDSAVRYVKFIFND